MKNLVLRFLVSRSGSILTPLVATVIGALVSRLASFDASLASGIDQAAVTGFVVATILAAVNYITNEAQTGGVKRIQALVNADQDGLPGPITYTEVRKALPANS